MLKRGQFIQQFFRVWDEIEAEDIKRIVESVKNTGQWPMIDVSEDTITLDYGDVKLRILRQGKSWEK